MHIKTFISRHDVVVYFVLAYLLACGGIFWLLGSAGLMAGPTPPMSTVLLVFLIMLMGPSVSSIGLTAWRDSRTGLQALLDCLCRHTVIDEAKCAGNRSDGWLTVGHVAPAGRFLGQRR